MTDDKDFKQLVRAEARRTGRRYSTVRTEWRPPVMAEPVEPMAPADVKAKVDGIVRTIESWVYTKPGVPRLVATALLVPGNVLFRAMPGNGMTALGNGVAAAIGGHVVQVDGRTGLDPAATASWRPDDVVVVAHFDGLEPADQVAVVEAGRKPAIVLAKCHPIPARMPHPPDDDNRERFLFGLELGPADAEVDLRIVNEYRDKSAQPIRRPAVDLAELAAMRAAAEAVEVPAAVRRFVVDVIAAARADDALLVGASTVAMLALVQAAAALAVADGRDEATIADVERIIRPVLAHRVAFRDGVPPDVDGLIERATAAV